MLPHAGARRPGKVDPLRVARPQSGRVRPQEAASRCVNVVGLVEYGQRQRRRLWYAQGVVDLVAALIRGDQDCPAVVSLTAAAGVQEGHDILDAARGLEAEVLDHLLLSRAHHQHCRSSAEGALGVQDLAEPRCHEL